jgi:hypothetical protein
MATDKINIVAGYLNAFAYEALDIADTAKTLTEAKYKDSEGQYAKRAVITIEDAQVRYCYEGSTPTSTVGHLANPMDAIVLNTAANIRNFKIIRKGTTSAKIKVTYEK